MDRNSTYVIRLPRCQVVALRKESVDRNDAYRLRYMEGLTSLSARRAWIEISAWTASAQSGRVALRKESVDRNADDAHPEHAATMVALRKESVDRNMSPAHPELLNL